MSSISEGEASGCAGTWQICPRPLRASWNRNRCTTTRRPVSASGPATYGISTTDPSGAHRPDAVSTPTDNARGAAGERFVVVYSSNMKARPQSRQDGTRSGISSVFGCAAPLPRVGAAHKSMIVHRFYEVKFWEERVPFTFAAWIAPGPQQVEVDSPSLPHPPTPFPPLCLRHSREGGNLGGGMTELRSINPAPSFPHICGGTYPTHLPRHSPHCVYVIPAKAGI